MRLVPGLVGEAAHSSPSPFARKVYMSDKQSREERTIDVKRVEAAEKELDAFVSRRAKDSKTGRALANEEARYWEARDARRSHAARLVNLKAWAAFHGGQALRHHDAAARAAQRRDEALALVRELKTNSDGGTA